MAELIQFSETSFPHDFLDQEPYTLIYDPGKKIRDHRTELAPFDSIVNVHYEVNSLINEIWRSRNKQLFLTLILPNTTDSGVRQFLSDHNICNQEHLHSLFLIFLNGLRCHHDWVNSLELRRLRWCRSCTTELKRDLYEVCRKACDEHITFYRQQRLLAEDGGLQRNGYNVTDFVEFYGQRERYCCDLLSRFP